MTAHDRDERVRLPLDPEDALRALLAVDPQEEPGAAQRREADRESDSSDED